MAISLHFFFFSFSKLAIESFVFFVAFCACFCYCRILAAYWMRWFMKNISLKLWTLQIHFLERKNHAFNRFSGKIYDLTSPRSSLFYEVGEEVLGFVNRVFNPCNMFINVQNAYFDSLLDNNPQIRKGVSFLSKPHFLLLCFFLPYLTLWWQSCTLMPSSASLFLKKVSLKKSNFMVWKLIYCHCSL